MRSAATRARILLTAALVWQVQACDDSEFGIGVPAPHCRKRGVCSNAAWWASRRRRRFLLAALLAALQAAGSSQCTPSCRPAPMLALPPTCPAVRITDVRLVGGATPREGRLEVATACAGPDGRPSDPATWHGGFCQTQIDSEDVILGVEPDALPTVVCRQLGFTGGRQQYFPPVAPLNRSQLAGNVICFGDEASVSRCQLNSGGGEKGGQGGGVMEEEQGRQGLNAGRWSARLRSDHS